MAVRPLVLAPDPLLAQVSAPVAVFDQALQHLVTDMIDTMYAAEGIGLAAVQVGVLQRVLISDTGRDEEKIRRPQVYVNPIITPLTTELGSYREGCLSIPKAWGEVQRPQHIKVEYADITGAPQSVELTGLAAVCLQHETDHLEGVLFIDHLPRLQRSFLLEKAEKVKVRLAKNKQTGNFN